jgi:hypothetical protein
MSTFEREAKPFLVPLITGQPFTLTPRAQFLVARWIVKTAMVFQYAFERQYIPSEHVRALCETRRCPDEVQVWIGNYTGVRIAGYHNQPLEGVYKSGPNRDIAYGTTLNLGKLAMQIFGHTLKGLALEVDRGPFDRYLVRIWPRSGAIEWPTEAVDDRLLDVLQEGFAIPKP